MHISKIYKPGRTFTTTLRNIMLEINSLNFDYCDKPLLSDITFTVSSGQLIYLKGANGTGKTTLLKLLAGILSPLAGQICYAGYSIYNNLQAFQNNLCYVGHKNGINLALTVKENCIFDLRWGSKDITLATILKTFNLHYLSDEICNNLSQGQKKKVSLLRLIFTQSKLWLLDEPLVGLDKQAVVEFTSILHKHLADGGLVIMTSHQPLCDNGLNYHEYILEENY